MGLTDIGCAPNYLRLFFLPTRFMYSPLYITTLTTVGWCGTGKFLQQPTFGIIHGKQKHDNYSGSLCFFANIDIGYWSFFVNKAIAMHTGWLVHLLNKQGFPVNINGSYKSRSRIKCIYFRRFGKWGNNQIRVKERVSDFNKYADIRAEFQDFKYNIFQLAFY